MRLKWDVTFFSPHGSLISDITVSHSNTNAQLSSILDPRYFYRSASVFHITSRTHAGSLNKQSVLHEGKYCSIVHVDQGSQGVSTDRGRSFRPPTFLSSSSLLLPPITTVKVDLVIVPCVIERSAKLSYTLRDQNNVENSWTKSGRNWGVTTDVKDEHMAAQTPLSILQPQKLTWRVMRSGDQWEGNTSH